MVPLTLTAFSGGLSPGDAAVRDFVLAHRAAPLDRLMLAVSWAGSEYVTPLVLIGLLAAFWRQGGRRRSVAVGLVAIVATSAVWQAVLKYLAGRPRPLPVVYPIWQGPGFPSGHVLTAVVLAFGLWRAAPWLGAGRRLTRVLGHAAILWPGLVGASRIYLNCHYLSDVLAGIFLGLGHIGLVLLLFAPIWLVRTADRPDPDGTSGARSIAQS